MLIIKNTNKSKRNRDNTFVQKAMKKAVKKKIPFGKR